MSFPTGTLAAHPIAEALASVGEALECGLGAGTWTLSDADLAGLLAESRRRLAQQEALWLRLVREADARDLAGRSDAPSTAAFLRGRLRLHPGEASAAVKLAKALDDDLAATGRALAAGDISGKQAQVIAGSVADLPEDVPPDLRGEAERELLGQARRFDPKVLQRLGRRLYEVVAPADAERRLGERLAKEEAKAVERRQLTFSATGPGVQTAHLRLEDAAMAQLKALLDPLARPRPTGSQRTNGPAGRDGRSYARRMADAFVDLLDLAAAAGTAPTRGGVRPHLTVTVALDTLVTGLGTATLDTGEQLSATHARLLACDAGILPAVLGSKGEVLDLGRERRYFTGTVRRALELRDRGCTFPGCDAPAHWCAAHHTTPWYLGGTTSLHTGVLICPFHHGVVHRDGWTIRMATDGRPEYTPPPWRDPQQHPLRNTLHHP